MAVALLHFVPATRWILCTEHVCRRRGRKLPQMSGRTGKGRTGEKSCEASQENREEAEE